MALVSDARTETPLSIGIFGPAGSGSTFAARQLAEGAVGGGGAAGAPKGQIVSVTLEASDAAGGPAIAVANAIWNALVATGDARTIALAEDATHTMRDPEEAAREANERLTDARRRLDAERRTLEETEGRRARLAETVLFDTAGSRVDAYGRANRTSIEARLRRFGFNGPDFLATWKDLVRVTAERGASGRLGAVASALWSYRGQAQLVVWAVIFLALAWALGLVETTQGTWAPWMRDTGGETMAPVAAWLQGHVSWAGTLRQVFVALAVIFLVLDVWRAFRFLQPLWRGAALLKDDIARRQQTLDTTTAHQARRVDQLAAEVDAAARRAGAAERRASGEGRAQALPVSPFRAEGPSGIGHLAHNAAHFLQAISAALSGDAAQRRLLVVLDGLHALPAPDAARTAAAVQRLLALNGFVLVVAGDAARLAQGFGHEGGDGAREALSRLVQVPFQLAPEPAGTLVERIAGTAGFAPEDRAIVEALAPLAGPTPRALKRFVTLYRLVRGDGPTRAAAALALAVETGGDAHERATYAEAVAAAPEGGSLALPDDGSRLASAHAALARAAGSVSGTAARAGLDLARTYALPGQI